ncbi:MAG: aminoacyl-tRNA hydrolase [Verrucomicrobiota bacterium]
MSLLDKFLSPKSADLEEDGGDSDGICLIVGLGNPGPEYDGTRHNIGFELVDQLASEAGAKWSRERKFRAKISRLESGALLAKPLTFMDLSGNAVSRLARSEKLQPHQILVVYDDIALPIGRLRFRPGGSAGGHNGMKSIIEYLGTDAFPRLRLGVGEPGAEETLIDHVLGRFTEDELVEVKKVLAIAQKGVNCALAESLEMAMSQFNRR